MGRPTDPVALVLGAGGSVGYAFHAGVLCALADQLGWDARRAELIVGTSAGAQVGAVLRGGLDPHQLYASITGTPLRSDRPAHPRASLRWPGSPRYLRQVLRHPWRARPVLLAAALLPEGELDNEPLGDRINALHPGGWPERPLWIAAVDLDHGTRVAFGRAGAPPVDVGTAVRCSSAIPGLRRPVLLDGTRYVDGAIKSANHLDLLAPPAPVEPSLILVLSPMSRYLGPRLRLRLEQRRLALGAPVVAIEPGPETRAAMGWYPLDARKGPRVAAAAYREALRQLDSRDLALLRAVFEARDAAIRSTSPTTLATSW